LRRLLLAAGLSVGLAAPSFAEPAVTTAWSDMRSAPSGRSRVVQSVPADAQIDLQDCIGDWCHASWRNLAGYIPAFAVGEAAAPPPVVAAPPPPVVVEAPIYAAPAYQWGGPYVGFGWGYGWRRW
jgi:uncharacterized protein YraI